MGFFSDLKFVKNYIGTRLNIEEFEISVLSHEKNLKELNSNIYNLTKEVEELARKKSQLQNDIEKLYDSKCKCEEGLERIYSLDTRTFLKDFLDNGYEFYKLNIEEMIYKDKDYGIPEDIKRFIDLYIQEFAALENIDFTSLRKVLYNVNKVWEETYNEINSKTSLLYKSNNIGIWCAITNFMMIRKKEELR